MFKLASVAQVLVSLLALVPSALALTAWNVSSSEFVRMLWMSSMSHM
jgi:hypothetical protein